MSKDRDLTSLRQELDNVQNLNASVNILLLLFVSFLGIREKKKKLFI